jgi:hypothetical protein
MLKIRSDGWYEVDVPGWETHEVKVLVHTINGAPKVVGLTYVPIETELPWSDYVITQDRLRRTPIHELAVLSGGLDFDEVVAAISAIEAHEPEDHRAVTTVESVVAVYRAALASGSLKPRQDVMERLSISARTADRYLNKARKDGLLEPYDGGRSNQPTERKRNG